MKLSIITIFYILKFSELALDARLLVALHIVSSSVPGGLFVEEPGVASPQKTVQKPEKNGGVGFSKTSHHIRDTVFDTWIFVMAFIILLTGVILFIDPVAVSDGLQAKKAVGPSWGRREPDEGNEGRHDEVNFRVVFLFISVEARVEEVEGETVREREYDIAAAEFCWLLYYLAVEYSQTITPVKT